MKIVRLPRIKGENFITSFCMDDCLATICNFWRKDISWIYFDSLNVDYFSENNQWTWQNLIIMDKYKEHIKEYLGITVVYDKFSSDIVNNIIDKLNKGSVIIIIMDSFFCPWDPSFGKNNGITKNYHSFIVNGFNIQKNIFVGMDPYYNRTNVEIDCDKLIKGYYKHIEVLATTEENKFEDEELLVNQQIKLLTSSEYWLKLYDFADDIYDEIKNIHNLKLEEQREYWSGLYQKIARIEYRCYYFCIYLTKLKHYLEKAQIEKLIELYMEIFDQWCVLAAIVMKNIIKESYDNIAETIKDKIKTIAQREKELVSTFNNTKKQIVNEKHYAPKVTQLKGFTGSRYVYIANYCDNKGIMYENDEKAEVDLTGYKEYFVISQEKSKEEYEISNNITFQLCKTAKDNICCNNQHIDMKKQRGRAILIVGCCEWGSYSAEFIIEYQNGNKESAIVSFADCDFSGINLGMIENVAMTNNFYSQGDVKKNFCAIYYQVFQLRNLDLEKIILPKCPNMHIFAMSILD